VPAFVRSIVLTTCGAGLIAFGATPDLSAAQERSHPNSGAHWLQLCEGSEGSDGEIACTKYLIAIDELAARLARTQPSIAGCPPPEATIGQVKDIVVKYLRNNPQRTHLRFMDLVMEAQRKAFPCPQATK
jgi:hypothetical protein